MENVYQPPAAPLKTSAAPKPAPRRRRLAALMGFFFPLGLAQLYNGQWKKAVKVMLATCALFMVGTALAVWGPHPWLGLALLTLAPLYSMVDGEATARRLGREYRRQPCNRWYVYLAWCFLSYWVFKGLVLLWSANVAQSFYIPSENMEPTVLAGEYVYAAKWSPGVREVERGDILIFESVEDPGVLVFSRAAGMPGDRIEVRGKQLYVNGQPPDEPYAVHNDPMTFGPPGLSFGGPMAKRDNMAPTVIPAGHYFILGDNRDNSYDSRFWGPVPEENVRGGKNVVIYWSRDPASEDPAARWLRWDRIGRVGD